MVGNNNFNEITPAGNRWKGKLPYDISQRVHIFIVKTAKRPHIGKKELRIKTETKEWKLSQLSGSNTEQNQSLSYQRRLWLQLQREILNKPDWLVFDKDLWLFPYRWEQKATTIDDNARFGISRDLSSFFYISWYWWIDFLFKSASWPSKRLPTSAFREPIHRKARRSFRTYYHRCRSCK